MLPFRMFVYTEPRSAKVQPRPNPSAAPCVSTPQTLCKLVTLRTPTDACISFLFNHSLTLRLRRHPTGGCVSPLCSCLCGCFPSQQGGTPLLCAKKSAVVCFQHVTHLAV